MSATVLYIAGWGRSGSTLLTSLLGQLPGAFAAGEVRSLWARGIVEERLCSCGRPVPECPIWGPVVERMRAAPMRAKDVKRFQYERLRTRSYPAALARRHRADAELRDYVATYRMAYEAVAEVTGAEVIVDSSKYPLDAFHLAEAGADLRVVHLVRDPRHVAASWRKPKPQLDGYDDELKRFSPLASSTIWLIWNELIDRLVEPAVGADRFMRLRFEDFLERPGPELERMAALAGIDWTAPEGELREVVIERNHLVAGNPDRFSHGPVEIRRPGPRSAALPVAVWLQATAPALPLLGRFEYPVRGGRR